MKTLVFLTLISVSCLQPRESLCQSDSKLCEEPDDPNDNPFDDNPYIYPPPIERDPLDPTDNGDNTGILEPGAGDDSDNDPSTLGNTGSNVAVITVNQLSAETKLTAITITGSCTTAGCIHAERGKNFELSCELWSACLSKFAPVIKTSTGMSGASQSPLCEHTGLKVSNLTSNSKLTCYFDNDVWINLRKKKSEFVITPDIITNKYICVRSSRQGNDLYISTKSGICDQNTASLQLEFKW